MLDDLDKLGTSRNAFNRFFTAVAFAVILGIGVGAVLIGLVVILRKIF